MIFLTNFFYLIYHRLSFHINWNIYIDFSTFWNRSVFEYCLYRIIGKISLIYKNILQLENDDGTEFQNNIWWYNGDYNKGNSNNNDFENNDNNKNYNKNDYVDSSDNNDNGKHKNNNDLKVKIIAVTW